MSRAIFLEIKSPYLSKLWMLRIFLSPCSACRVYHDSDKVASSVRVSEDLFEEGSETLLVEIEGSSSTEADASSSIDIIVQASLHLVLSFLRRLQ